MLLVREATGEDLDAIVSLTATVRRRLAGWSPAWWRASADADELHAAWLAQLIASGGPVVRVVSSSGHVVGCAISMPQARQWSVDDCAFVDDAHWADAGVTLLDAIVERPALMCVPTSHLARRATSEAARLRHVSSYWIRATTSKPASPLLPLEPATSVPVPPPHTFGGAIDPTADGALALTDGDGGLVIGSPPIAAPPVYDPGGPVCIVDRVAGDPEPLLDRILATAGGRGDALVAVVAGVDDHRLRHGLQETGFERTVDVFAWPPRRGRPRGI